MSAKVDNSALQDGYQLKEELRLAKFCFSQSSTNNFSYNANSQLKQIDYTPWWKEGVMVSMSAISLKTEADCNIVASSFLFLYNITYASSCNTGFAGSGV